MAIVLTMENRAAVNLAQNLKRLRDLHGLTQHQLAKLSTLPRPTWANLESGSANPTLAVLMRVAGALQVSLEELTSAPREMCQHFKAKDIPTIKRGEVRIRKMLGEGLPGIEFDRMELPARTRMAGVPHRGGTREYLTCEQGVIELSLSGERFTVGTGEVVVFRGDQRHGYYNPTAETAVGYSVVMLAPLPIW